MRRIFAVVVCGVLSSGLALTLAQEEAPEPSPEHQKLGYFVGNWASEGELKSNPFMPGGKFTNKDTCKWFEGGFSVVCRSEGNGPMGPSKGLAILGYSTDEKAYTYYGVENGPMTMASVPHGTIDGDTWTYHDEAKMGGQTVKSRYVIKQLSMTRYSFKWEMLGEDGKWQTFMEGQATKSAPAQIHR